MKGNWVTISVALATYNGAKYLREQLDSIAAQTLLPLELVISDDGSTDDTMEIINGFAKTAPFEVRVIRNKKNLGFADNFLSCASACHGELIAFCDQDDVWLADKLERMQQRIVADNSLLAMHRLTLTDQNLQPQGVWTQDIVTDDIVAPMTLFPYRGGWGNSMMFRRALLRCADYSLRPKHPEKKTRLSHDTWIYILAAALGRISRIQTPLILYRQHGRNESQTAPRTALDRLRMRTRLTMDLILERQEFYGCLSELFSDASKQPGEFAPALAAAAAAYAQMRDNIKLRTDIYYLPRFDLRWSAFRHAQLRAAPSLAGRAKDIALGVSGLHSLLVR